MSFLICMFIRFTFLFMCSFCKHLSTSTFLSMLMLILSGCIIFYVFNYYRWVGKYPKGPTPVPFFGNLFQLRFVNIQDNLKELSEVYGPVFTVFLPRPFLCIMDYSNMKEAFETRGDDFAGRSGVFPNTIFQQTGVNGGVIFSQGEVWKENRRLSLHILRDFGMGKNRMEEQVVCSLQDLLDHLDAIVDKGPLDMREQIQLYVANVINKTLYNYIYNFDKCERVMLFADTLNEIAENIRNSPLTYLCSTFPFIAKLPIIGYYAQGRYMERSKTLQHIVREDVDAVLQNYNINDEPQCFVQAYRQRTTNNEVLASNQIYDVAMDFFLAGMETTSTTLRWGIYYLAKYQDVQEKIRQEVLDVVGSSRFPSLTDRPNMPYTNASVLEIQRMANILPLNVIHRTVRDTTLAGKPVPENTLIWGQVHAILSGSPVFEKPELFDPARFLMEDGRTPNMTTVKQAVPFSVGKRQCAGEGLAKLELFLGVATLLQRFRFEPAKGWTMDLRSRYGTINFPHKNYLKVSKIKH